MDELNDIDLTASKIVRDGYKRFQLAYDNERETRELALDDLKFSLGGDNQWDQDVINERDEDYRPHLTNNKLPAFVHQVCNNQRINRPAVMTSPVGDGASDATSNIYQGLIRHIEYRSDADSAYDTATEYAVRAGFGYIRVITEYEDPFSFDQEIKIMRVDNPFSVYMDPAAVMPDRSDAMWCQIGEWLLKEDYKRLYGNTDLSKESNWKSLGDACPQWLDDERCRVIEEFIIEHERMKIFLSSDRRVLKESEVQDYLRSGGTLMIKDGDPVSRVAQLPKVLWRKMNGIEVIEKQDWPGSIIPVVAVIGKELNIDGKRHIEGLIRQARDPQKMVNYYATAQAEAIGTAPKSPWLVPVGADEGLEREYEEVNRRNLTVLHYRQYTADGKDLRTPSRETLEPAIAAINHAYIGASEDLKSALGMFDPSLGNRDSARSGVAIRSLQSQGDMANFHFSDNLHKSIRHLGRILVDLIPKIYDTERIVRIIGPDDVAKQVTINSAGPVDGNPLDESTGQGAVFNMKSGKYDVTVKAGPSFQSRRQEEAAFMLEVIRSRPDLLQIIGDLVFKVQDSPGAKEISERLAKMLPPELREQKAGGGMPPEAQKVIKEQLDMIEALTKQLNATMDELEDKKVELASKERIALYQSRTTILTKLADLHKELGKQSLENELRLVEEEITALNQKQSLVPDDLQNLEGGLPQPPEPQPSTGMLSLDAGEPGELQDPNNLATGGMTPGLSLGGVPNA